MSIRFAPTRGCRIEEVPPLDNTFEVGDPSLVPSPPPHLLGHEDATRTSDDVLALQARAETVEAK
ncbi:hypothetical protein Tco_1190140, partial [Tanacetum coccineum]